GCVQQQRGSGARSIRNFFRGQTPVSDRSGPGNVAQRGGHPQSRGGDRRHESAPIPRAVASARRTPADRRGRRRCRRPVAPHRSPATFMILADTSVLSTFARVDALKLLWELFPGRILGLTPAVFREITEAIAQGCAW